jgi:hypothetical protein
MPSFIPLEKNEIKRLKNVIEVEFDLKIEDSFSCKSLSSIILAKSGKSISYNTLRRLFGIVSTNNGVSLYSLNIIANVVGFRDFNHFKSYYTSFDIESYNYLLFSSELNCHIDRTLLISFIKNLQINSWQEAYQLKHLIDLSIKFNDYSILKELIDIVFNLQDQLVVEKLYICFQSFYIETSTGNKKLLQFVEDNINTSPVLQRVMLQTYVEEKQLVGYYGKWLTATKFYLLYDIELFKNLMLCQKEFIQKDLINAKTFLKNALKILDNNKLDIHPILKGRIAAWTFILKKDEKLTHNLFLSLPDTLSQALFMLFFYRLIWEYDSETILFDFVERFEQHNIPKIKNAFEKEVFENFWIIESLYFHYKGDLSLAKESCKKFAFQFNKRIDIDWFAEKMNYLKSIYNN